MVELLTTDRLYQNDLCFTYYDHNNLHQRFGPIFTEPFWLKGKVFAI